MLQLRAQYVKSREAVFVLDGRLGNSAWPQESDNGNGRISCTEARAHGIAPVERGGGQMVSCVWGEYVFLRDCGTARRGARSLLTEKPSTVHTRH